MERKLVILLRIINGKIKSEAKWEHCSINEISMAIANLEMIKKSLVETLENLSNKQKTDKPS